MIEIDKLPSSDFTVDEVVSQNFDRQEVVATLRRMEQEGKGTFTIGRRGGKSRWEWKGSSKKPIPQTNYEPPQNSWSHIQAAQYRKDHQNLADLTGFRGTPTPVAIYEHISGLIRELKCLRNNTVVEEPVGIKHVPLDWLIEKPLDNGFMQIGWSFWDQDQRQAIAEELLTYRKGK